MALGTQTHVEDVVEDRPSWAPRTEGEPLDDGICPFLRAVADGELTAPLATPDPANRCAALREVVPQSRRQQELVCLTSGHVNCPRYLRGSAVAPEAPRPVVRTGSSLSPAILGSLLVVVLALSASVAFVLSRGGLALEAAVPQVSVAPSPSAVAAATPSVVASAEPTATRSAAPTASPTAVPTPSLTPTPTLEPTATPQPTSDRYNLLSACPDAPRCWIYQVRAGDNLSSIANYFGVSLDSIYDRNPWLRTSGLRRGQELRLPPPTR